MSDRIANVNDSAESSAVRAIHLRCLESGDFIPLLKSGGGILAYWGDERDEKILCTDLGEFAGHIVDLYKQNQTQEFPAVFDSSERLHIESDDYVKEAAIICLLEGIQNIAGNSGIDPEVFAPYLKPESAKW